MAADPLNTFVGSGVLKFKAVGETEYYDFGFVRQFQTNPAIERKDYWSKRSGIRSRVRQVTTQQGLTVSFIADEIISENLAIYLMGTATPGSPYTTVQIMDKTEILGALRFVGDNAFGTKCQVDVPHVSLAPAGGIDWLTDDWLGLEISGEAFRDDTTGDFGTVLVGITEEVA